MKFLRVAGLGLLLVVLGVFFFSPEHFRYVKGLTLIAIVFGLIVGHRRNNAPFTTVDGNRLFQSSPRKS